MRIAVPLLAFVLACFSAEPPAVWTPEGQMKVRAVASVVPSPDGKKVVWTESWPVMEGEKSEYLTHIFLAGADGSGRVQLTRGEKSAESPVWSPDGKYVYFSSPRDGKPKIFRISTEGGEAEAVTRFEGTFAAWRVSPDGKWIAFAGRPPDAAKGKAVKERTDLRVVDENPARNSLWVVSADPALAASRPPREIGGRGTHIGDFQWSPDSRRVAYERYPRPEADFSRHADIAEVEVESGTTRDLAATAMSEAQPRYSPDGAYLAYIARAAGRRLDSGTRILLLDLRKAGKPEPRELPATFDENPFLSGWAADSRRILFQEGRRTKLVVYAMPVDGPAAVAYEPKAGTAGEGIVNARGTHLGLVLQAPSQSPEAFVMTLPEGQPVQVSQANAGLPQLPLGETRMITRKARDGRAIEGLLTLPVGYQPGQRVPLILNIHGGPAGAFFESFIGSPAQYPIASFAARGYAVLRPNPRGSAAYGLEFRKSNYQDWGGGDYEDLMAGVDHVIESGTADPDKLAVMGWSYGGYMTAWTITQTTRFKAAAVGAGITNNISMYGTQDIPSVFEDYFGGPPWQELELYLDRSPMYHAGKVKTPTLILHGAEDERVPPGQAYELYNALKRRNIETRMVIYPRTAHGPREPKIRLDVMQQHLDWVEKYLK
jgi:dipeptidyl aminopeptidase/acylaminoacyl peptidase